MWFMLAAGARPKETKINRMGCICMCSEVEIVCKLRGGSPKESWGDDFIDIKLEERNQNGFIYLITVMKSEWIEMVTVALASQSHSLSKQTQCPPLGLSATMFSCKNERRRPRVYNIKVLQSIVGWWHHCRPIRERCTTLNPLSLNFPYFFTHLCNTWIK